MRSIMHVFIALFVVSCGMGTKVKKKELPTDKKEQGDYLHLIENCDVKQGRVLANKSCRSSQISITLDGSFSLTEQTGSHTIFKSKLGTESAEVDDSMQRRLISQTSRKKNYRYKQKGILGVEGIELRTDFESNRGITWVSASIRGPKGVKPDQVNLNLLDQAILAQGIQAEEDVANFCTEIPNEISVGDTDYILANAFGVHPNNDRLKVCQISWKDIESQEPPKVALTYWGCYSSTQCYWLASVLTQAAPQPEEEGEEGEDEGASGENEFTTNFLLHP